MTPMSLRNSSSASVLPWSSRKSGVTAGSRPTSSLQDIELAMFKRRDAPRHR